ncbi:MAG: TraR/DksA C4-type zinc finger protein [Undibacterium sp.]|nr:TraR/DksA C4-type zinc finger protein [Undibacterium sp.]
MSLTPTEKNTLNLALNALQERIQGELQLHRLNTAQVDSSAGDDVIADVLEGDAVAQYLHQHAEWQALQMARARFDADLSDVCMDCDAPIPFARLQVEPTAVRCIACQSAIELKNTRSHIAGHSSL